MFQNRRVKVGRIDDGTSQTLAVGECIYDEQQDKWAALWAGMIGTQDNGVRISRVMWSVGAGSAVVNGPAPQAFSGRHPGGAQFGFCDGSVRCFRKGGDVQTLRFLAGRNDGVIFQLEDS